ncbi:MAG: TolC family protein [Acidobacteriota bacterium]
MEISNGSGRCRRRFTSILVLFLFTTSITSATSGVQDQALRDSSKQEDTAQPVNLTNFPTPLYSQYVDQTNGVSAATLISEARQRSKDLLAAQQNVAIIRGRLVQSGLRPNPTVDTEYATDRLGTGEGEYDFSIAYIQPIELSGKRGKRIRVAQLEFDQAEKELAFQERQLATEIESQYAEALAATESLRVTEQLIALNQETLRVTQVRFSEGDVARLDVNLVCVEVNRLRTQQLQAENRTKAALLQLKTLSGMNVEESLKLRTDLTSVRLPDTLNLEDLQTTALHNRADLQAARIGENVAEARISLAKTEASPELNLFGRYQQEKSVIDDTPVGRLVDSDKLVAFGASITLPIRNRNQGTIAEAVATKVQTRHRREFLEQIVKRDVAVAFSKLQMAKDSIRLYQTEILPRSQENLQIIRTAYDLGDQQLLDVVAEQRRLIEAQQQYIDALKEYYLSIIELERAVGSRIR